MKAVPEELIVRYLSNHATEREQEDLLTWVSDSSENQRIFLEFTDAWDIKYSSSTLQTEQALERLNNRIDTPEISNERSGIAVWLKYAAAIAALVSIAGVSVLFIRTGFSREAKMSSVTSSGARKKIMLPDGTMVTLSRNSAIEFPEQFEGGERKVHLTGKAFFDVKHNPDKPFRIHSGMVTTEVLGTSFTIDHRTHQFNLTVATGKVKVSHGNTTSVMLPNQQLTFDTLSQSINMNTVDASDELLWSDGVLRFNNTSLQTVAAKIQDEYAVQVVIMDQPGRNCRITGTFENEHLENVLEALRYSTGIEINSDEQVITFSGTCK